MIRHLSLLFFLGLFSYLSAQTEIIALHHNGTPSYHTELDSAFFYAIPGDTMYLPGGDFFPDGGQWDIDKEIHIFGVGYRSDSSAATGPTRIIGKVNFDVGSDGSSMHGLQVTTWLRISSTVEKVTLSRLSISEYFEGFGSKCVIKECLVFATFFPNDCLNMNGGSDNQFFNCVFYGGVHRSNGNRFDNCIFQLNGEGLSLSTYSIFTNSIFVTSIGSTFNTSNLTFDHCLFSASSSIGGSPNVLGSVENVNMSDVVVDFSNANIISNDYHLKTPAPGNSNPAVNSGNLEQDCGVYDGLFPLKDNRHPSHPRIKFKNIAPYTDANGNLQIEVTVEAQGN